MFASAQLDYFEAALYCLILVKFEGNENMD